MKTKTTIFLFILAGLVNFSFTPPPTTKYKVDSKQSSLLWTGKKVTGQHSGAIVVESGELVAEDKTIKEGSFNIDVRSITVTDLQDKESNQKLVNHLKGDDFFAAEKFPTATFSLSSITPKSGNEYLVKGRLTIKGKTNDIEFPATIVTVGKTITATAKITVDRTKYDIRYGSKTFFDNLGDKYIYDDFDLDLKLVASSQTGA